MAKRTAMRCSGAPLIPHRSWRRRRPGAVGDAPVAPLRGRAPNGVKKMRMDKRENKGARRGYGDAGVGRKPWSTAADRGGTASSIPSSLGALGLSGVGQTEEEEEGFKMGIVEGEGRGSVDGLKRGVVRRFRP